MNDAWCLFGARTVAELLERLTTQEEGVRNSDDIEYVHRMRVSTRRLREALPLFRECFPSENFGRWARTIRRLTRTLGEARDDDVQIASVVSTLENASTRDVPGLARLLLRLRQKRAGFQKNVNRALERFSQSGTASSMEACARALSGRSYISEPGNAGEIRPGVSEALRERIAHVMGFDVPVRNPANVTRLHDMRKAFKRLRYTLEIFAPLYDGALEGDIKKMKSLQDILGTLHDCDIWLETLPNFIEEERERTLIWQGHTRGFSRVRFGLENFAAAKRETRNTAYDAFIAAWDGLCGERWWESVLKNAE